MPSAKPVRIARLWGGLLVVAGRFNSENILSVCIITYSQAIYRKVHWSFLPTSYPSMRWIPSHIYPTLTHIYPDLSSIPTSFLSRTVFLSHSLYTQARVFPTGAARLLKTPKINWSRYEVVLWQQWALCMYTRYVNISHQNTRHQCYVILIHMIQTGTSIVHHNILLEVAVVSMPIPIVMRKHSQYSEPLCINSPNTPRHS